MKILEGFKKRLKDIAESYERHSHGTEILFSAAPLKAEKVPSTEEYLMPPVIVWDPLLQCSDIFQNDLFCPHESHATQPSLLVSKKWKDGLSDRHLPRKIYGANCMVLLMSRVYVCSHGHELAAHDPRILERLPTDFKMPFFLSHKSGVTTEFLNSVNSLASAGLTFSEVERHLAQNYYDWYWAKEEQFLNDFRLHHVRNAKGDSECGAFEDTPKSFPDPKEWIELPSDDIITSCFALNFREFELFYTQKMSELSALYISADHTFKVAANIGIHLQDKKWVTQYDSLFCILNEKGQVVAWQLTKGTSFNQVETLLKGLKSRLDKQGVVLKAVYVDNCCQVRQKVQNVFGNVPVKLDLFHAISRVTQKIPKQSRHILAGACIIDFSNVFRCKSDKEEERKEETPSSDELLDNLKDFLVKWKDMKHTDDEDVLTASAVHEIDCLKKHIEKGCLSGIPPRSGSEKNENLHKNLRHIVARSRLGVESALALLTIFFYYWNERRYGEFPKGVVKPISSYATKLRQIPLEATTEVFGLCGKANVPMEIRRDYSHFLSASSDVFELHSHLEKPEVCGSQTLYNVLTKGLNFLLIDKQLKKLSDSRSFNPRLIHLMSCSLALFSNEQYPVTAVQESRESLKQVLLEYGLQLCQHPLGFQCGDSFFFALLSGISNLLSQLKEKYSEEYSEVLNHLSSLGITAQPDHVKNDVKCLRMKLSDELLENAAEYQALVVSSDINFSEEAANFKKEDYFRGEMGNLLTLAATKIIRLSVVIFTSLMYIPVVPVVSNDATLSSRCLFIGFDAGSGTFHSLLQTSGENANCDSVEPSTSSGIIKDTKDSSCNCGRGRAKNDPDRKFCKQIVGCMPSRCMCYINMKGCSFKCHCSHCDNPYGTSDNAKASYTLTRVRQPSRLKVYKVRTDAEFLLSKNVTPLLGWSDFESMIFDCLVDHMISKDINLDAPNCLSQYVELCVMAKQEGINCLGPKNLNQVQGKLLHVRRCAAVFEALYKKQIETNWFL